MNRRPKKTGTRPFIFINMAMTADGKIASANRAVSSFGSQRDRAHLYELRATADAVICGARTVETEAATLGPGGEKFQRRRQENSLAEYNLRVIVTGSGSINPKAAIFKPRFSPIIVLTTQRISAQQLKQLREVADEVKILGETEINFRQAVTWLRRKWKVKRLLCEGGGELNGALFQAGLIDQIHLTICPKVFGGRTAPSIADGEGFAQLDWAEKFKLDSAKRIKGELFTVFSRR